MGVNDQSHLLEIDLLTNAVDFILRAIDELFNNDILTVEYVDPATVLQNSYKYGTLHLFSGFLLLLKERLYRHVPELIYKGNIDQVRQTLAKGRFPPTVNLEEALERLQIGPRFTFNDDERKVIVRIQNYRNDLEHYRISANRHEMWKTLTKFLNIIDRFMIEQLNIDMQSSSVESSLIQKIRMIDSVRVRYIDQQTKDWQHKMEVALLKYRRNPERIRIAIRQADLRDKGVKRYYIICPDCQKETLILSGNFAGICTNADCEATASITRCERCGSPAPGFAWETVWCADCTEYFRLYHGDGILDEYEPSYGSEHHIDGL